MALFCLLVGVLTCLGYLNLDWVLYCYGFASYLSEMLSNRHHLCEQRTMDKLREMMQRFCQSRARFA